MFEEESSYAIMLNELYVVGASIAAMALQMKAANFAMQDLNRLADLCTRTKCAKELRSNPRKTAFASSWNKSKLACAHVSHMKV